MKGNKRKINRGYGIFVIPFILIGITICVREILLTLHTVTTAPTVLPIPLNANTGPKGSHVPHVPHTSESDKHSPKKLALYISKDIFDVFPLILKIVPGSAVEVSRFLESGYYNIDIVGRDIVTNKIETQNFAGSYIIVISIMYNGTIYSKWSFIEKIDLKMRSMFVMCGSTIVVQYNAPLVHPGYIGIRIESSRANVSGAVFASLQN